jgi:hypothetical protein
MSTKASPKLENEHVVAATNVKRGTTDQAQFVDVESVVNRETVGAAEDIVASVDDNDVEKGCVTRVDDPPDGLDCDGKLLEEEIEGSRASLEVVGDTERTDNAIIAITADSDNGQEDAGRGELCVERRKRKTHFNTLGESGRVAGGRVENL